MPAERLEVRNIREILRLRFDLKLSHRDIGRSINKSPSTVGETLAKFAVSGLDWPLGADLDDAALEERLYQKVPADGDRPPTPDWAAVIRELRRRDYHVTRLELWKEYRQANPSGFEYSWFCQELEQWLSTIEPVMRQTHKCGEKCFVDYTGDKVPIVDAVTGEVTEAEVFVGAMGASSYTFVKASRSQSLPDWIAAHTEMFGFFGVCPAILVPDNLRSGVSKAEFYEPAINPTYNEMAKHYGVAVLPARRLHPKDKAKVEGAVLIVEREILAPLRKRTFFDLASLNEAINELQEILNDRPFQKLPGNRREFFEREERPVMRALPTDPYEFGLWKRARVHIDYHVQVDGHYYSVAHHLVRQAVETRMTASVVEIFHLNIRVASHRRSFVKGGHTTLREHMPASHRAVSDWTPEKVLDWAGKVGPSTNAAARQLLERRQHPEQGVRSCLGLLSLKKYGRERLERACTRALSNASGAIYSYKTVKNILEKNLDVETLPPRSALRTAGDHENLRGPQYFEGGVTC